MSKYASFLVFVIALSALTAPLTARADSKYWMGGWSEKHWENLNFEKPYYEPSKEPHNSQWDYDDWKSSDWFAQKDSRAQLINGFYNADILHDQYIDNDMPVLEVGPNFFNLGGQDKRRVVQSVDETFGITGSKLFGSFMIYDWQSKKAIGIYTQQGLQLQ